MRTLCTLVLAVIPCVFAGSSCASAQENDHRSVVVTTSKQPRAWLGLSLNDMTADLAKEKKIKTDEGAYVAGVVEDSPAEKAGIEKGDIVVVFNGRNLYDAQDLTKAVGKAEPGSTATVVVMRNEKKKTFQVKLGRTPKAPPMFGFSVRQLEPLAHLNFHGSGSNTVSGMKLLALNPQLADFLSVPGSEGVLVERVKKGSTAEKAGFKAGDVIVRIDKSGIADLEDVWEVLGESDTVQCEISRKGTQQTLSLAPEGQRSRRHYRWRSDDESDAMEMFERESPSPGFPGF